MSNFKQKIEVSKEMIMILSLGREPREKVYRLEEDMKNTREERNKSWIKKCFGTTGKLGRKWEGV